MHIRKGIFWAMGAIVLATSGCGGDGIHAGTVPTTTSNTTTTTTVTSTTTKVTETHSGEKWTSGPDLPDCTPVTGDGDLVALSGVLLLPSGPTAGTLVYSRTSGLIECAGASCDTTDATVICTDGVVSPGLIDAHDHMQYNLIPPWQHDGKIFDDRYDWQSDGDYWDYRTAYDEVEDAYSCEIMQWAEIRGVVGGATSVVGSSGDDNCIGRMMRNLDESYDSHGLSDYYLYYSSSNVTGYDEDDGSSASTDLAIGYYNAILNHVAEGVGGSVEDELDHMDEIGMHGAGFAYVHATDADTAQLARMADKGTTLVWSPRSNLDLYAATTAGDVANRMGVSMALGPDWTWSGSMSPSHEAACAVEYLESRGTFGENISDKALWQMFTINAAMSSGAEEFLGSLEMGLEADIAVFAWSAEPYRSVLQAADEDVRMVIVGGEAVYGVSDLISGIADKAEWCETVTACSEDRMVCLKVNESGDYSNTMAYLESTLSSALGAVSMPSGFEYAGELHGLWSCDESRASCDISAPSSGDEDGDGVADTDDLCTGAYDPLQRDHDGDGVGDACDPCPLNPESDVCSHTPGDIDGDSISSDSDICPYFYDPDQSDSDSDGHGDGCDECPDDSNPGDEPCPVDVVSIDTIRNSAHPDHPAEGSAVAISGAVVVGVRSGTGFYVQDPALTEYGGIWVYDAGEKAVLYGDVVDVIGTYIEYYGLSEIEDATTTITGTAQLPDPMAVADPCSIATDGSDAERYESMLVSVADVSVTNSNPDDPDEFGEFEVAGCLRVDDEIYTDLVELPSVGTTWSTITGVLTYTWSNHKVVPTDAADLVD